MSYEEFPRDSEGFDSSEQYNDFSEKEKYSLIITDLVRDMSDLIQECRENKYNNYTKQDLELIEGRMSILLDQGMFWLVNGNQPRYIYDLNDFISWLCEFMETKEMENDE